jgi:hypothetical protein
MPYNIFLVDIVDVLDSNKRAKVKGILDGYFGKVFAHRPELANTFGSPTCSFSTDPKPTTRRCFATSARPTRALWPSSSARATPSLSSNHIGVERAASG